MRFTAMVAAYLGMAACGSPIETGLRDLGPGAEAISLFGDTLRAPEQPAEVREGNEQRLATALADYEADPGSADALIWLGRRTAYLGRYREAIGVFTDGIRAHRDDARMYRHRGHRYISVRRFDLAIQDLEHAAGLIAGQPDEVEPDGQPNARNIPTGTLQFNIWYHLGLAYYLTGDLDNALRAYRECLLVSKNPDVIVAASYWLYTILQRLDRAEDAIIILETITPDMDVIENQSYQTLLLLNKGEVTASQVLDTSGDADVPLASATVGYGVANWHAFEGRGAEAEEILNAIVDGNRWDAFGYIAAESDLASRR